MQRVADWITKELLELGVKRVYLLQGGFSQTLDDAITHSELQPIYCMDERACGFAACAEAQYTNQLGVCAITSGPGSTNILTAVASAWDDSLPLLVISGEVRIPHVGMREKYNLREGGPQDVDICKIARPIVKYIEMALNPVGVKWIFEQAVRYAMEGRRGPAWMVLPLDCQSMGMEDV